MKSVAIIGAGPAGLTAALAAQRFGVPVVVYEQSPEFSQTGAGFLIHSNGLRVLDALDLWSCVCRHIMLTTQLRTESAVGELITTFDYSKLDIPRNHGGVVLREDLRRYLYESVLQRGVPINFGHELQSLKVDGGGCARVQFSNGHEEEHSMVIACDGVNSRVRSLTELNARIIPASYVTYAGVSSSAPAVKAAREIWSHGEYFGVCPLPDDTSFFYAKGLKNPSSSQLTAWVERWKNSCAEVGHVLQGADLNKLVRTEFREVCLNHWYRPPIFFIGDAAHAMKPNLGQGANSSMVDALVLVRLIAEMYSKPVDLERVGFEFQSIRKPFVSRVQWFARQIDVFRSLTDHNVSLCRDSLLRFCHQFRPPSRYVMSLIAGYNPREERFFQ